MEPTGNLTAFESAALERRRALAGASGPMALLKNLKVFSIACFACLGGLLYGYNQGVFSGVLTMTSFKERKYPATQAPHDYFILNGSQIDMGSYTSDQTKLGWLTSILELGAWFGTLYSGFLAEILSRKYAILINVAIFIIGVVVQTTAVTSSGHSSILGGRFVTGRIVLCPGRIFVLKFFRHGRWIAQHDCPHV
jgi:MFS family permease